MDSAPFVSIIVPIYNVELYLRECLDSIINQTYKNLEIILINDGSSDNSGKIAQEYAALDSRIKYMGQENKGVASARNMGIKVAQGEYVCFMDPDDFYPDANTIELLCTKAQKNDALICGGCFSEYMQGKIVVDFPPHLFGYTFEKEDFVEYKDYQFDFGWTRFIYRLDFLLANNIFQPPYTKYEDPPFFVQAMIKAQRFYAVPEVTYRYRIGHKIGYISWDKKSWVDQIRGLNDVLTLASKNDLAILYELSISRAKQEMRNLSRGIYEGQIYFVSPVILLQDLINCAQKGTLDKAMINRYNGDFGDFDFIQKCKAAIIVAQKWHLYAKKYFRIRLFKEYNIIKIFGCTIYKSSKS
ncbi:hypothetical protein BKN38_01210 [Helicobacter sp. CLO-3]|uniref:glycosyltransferase family 2 protein n=1 Tax=unclassified Helicobacter TaxID=2593540 RepID=UPI000804DBAC|nr:MULTISPECIES: glycosyltransferase [unclassified Helicobacter]OBV29734.1 hypothetical protein BA723_00015 [Helicobacter sp. CLO-3]OHU85187.1 hypothetical protein BKN38_01210 [Helicobacter sp. CLO-3]